MLYLEVKLNKLLNNKSARWLLASVVGASFIGSLQGCAVVMVGAAVGTAVSVSDRRTFGSQTEDNGIEIKAGNRISTVFGDAVHVNVTSYNRKVLLTGEVKDAATKARVEAEVAAIENVNSVVNELHVTMFLSTFGARSNDNLIGGKVRSKLIGTKDIYYNSFKITVEANVVYLMGRVSYREGATAAAAVQEVGGVSKIVKVFEYIDEAEIKKYTAQPAPEQKQN